MFSCPNFQTKVVFKAHLRYSSGISTKTADELVTSFSSWVKSGPSLTVSGSVLNVDPTCPAEVESLTDEDCEITNSSLHTRSRKPTKLLAGVLSGSLVVIMIITATVVLISVLGVRRRMDSIALKMEYVYKIVMIITCTLYYSLTP